MAINSHRIEVLYWSISPVLVPIMRANESARTSLRTQWISLKIFRCRLNLLLLLRGNNLLAYYAPLSLSQDFWMVHQWKISQLSTQEQSRANMYFFVNYFTSWQVRWPLWAHSACFESTGHLSMGLFQPQNSPGRHAHTENSLHTCWPQTIRTQATLLLSLLLQSQVLLVLDCKLHRQGFI